MDLMRADMGGAATICSAIVSAAKLNLPVNVIGEWECEGLPECCPLGDLELQT